MLELKGMNLRCNDRIRLVYQNGFIDVDMNKDAEVIGQDVEVVSL